MYSMVISRSLGFIKFVCVSIGYLVSKHCENMNIYYKDMPIYALQFTIWVIWPHNGTRCFKKLLPYQEV